MKEYFQRLGRSLMLPVAVLPAAAILLGLGYAIDPAGWGGGSALAVFLIKAGGSIIDNMAILFAVGVALRNGKRERWFSCFKWFSRLSSSNHIAFNKYSCPIKGN